MSNDAIVTMTLTPFMERIMREDFDLEIEFLQGERVQLPDGRARIKIEVTGEKSELVKEFILKTISNSPNANLS